ncbi:MAG: hypothetical protein KF850_04290 [Labilithrix sp.]|nr:hypothetical protein [Labilithrix sp.]MBX3211229.1 hypothetical protein [Labilithrix sp.]
MRRPPPCRLRPRVGWERRGGVGGRRGVRWLVALGASIGTLATAASARTESKFAFSWRSEPGATCLTEDKLRAAVEKKLGRSVFASLDEAELVIEGQELRDRDRFRARVEQHDRAGREHGSRELTAETCAALERMTVVFIAFVLEPGGAPDRTHGEPTPDARAQEPRELTEAERPARQIVPKDGATVSASETASSPSRRPTVMKRPPARRAPRVELHAGAGAGAAVGILPRASASVRVTTRLTAQGSRLSADWSLGMTLPQIATDGAARASFAAVDQQTRGCWAWLDRAARIDTCAGLFFGALLPTSTNLDNRDTPALSVLGPTASLALRVTDGPATFHVELGVVAPSLRRSISYLDRDGADRTLHAMPALMGLATMSATFRVF